MSEPTLSPLKTWSHLAEQRRRPSEYEIVSTNLHWHTRGDQAFDIDDKGFMNEWYREYRNESPITHENWDSFRDPDEMIYRGYNILQDGQENYVLGLLDQFSDEEHDKGLDPEWIEILAHFYTPGRYLMHCAQMASAYLVHISPASTISNCAAFQAADCLRWVSHISYRTKELSITHPSFGFAEKERENWEKNQSWQAFRELMERMLAAKDWAESFLALNIIAKPAIDEAFFRGLRNSGRRANDTLIALLAEAALRDSDRSRRWTTSLVEMILSVSGNRSQMELLMDKWCPLANSAIENYCSSLPNQPGAVDLAMSNLKKFHSQLGL